MTALVSIESARYFGATLRVVYIQSIISDLYKILQAYQEEGIILIKDGFDMPKLKDHPEIDSAHHNQAIAINDCLNQFKDAADFIVVADWDDIFLTGFESELGVGALGPAYNKGLNVADFFIDQRSKDSTIGAFILEWMKTERSDMIGKYAMVPAAVKSASVHYPLVMEGGYKQKKYHETDGVIVYHLNKKHEDLQRRLFSPK
uniref:Glycosyltransferase family 92 protein n=1 Tax=Parascaris univalens TaxID=6257 RepID=A0A914ZWC8_PARUN